MISSSFGGALMHELDYAIFPHVNNHPRAVFSGLGDREGSWNWFLMRVRHGVKDPQWRRSELADNLSAPLPKLFRRIGDCRYPLYLAPKVSVELLEICAVLCGRRVDAYRCCMAPEILGSHGASTRLYCLLGGGCAEC